MFTTIQFYNNFDLLSFHQFAYKMNKTNCDKVIIYYLRPIEILIALIRE